MVEFECYGRGLPIKCGAVALALNVNFIDAISQWSLDRFASFLPDGDLTLDLARPVGDLYTD